MIYRFAAAVLLSVLSVACAGPTVTGTPPSLRLDPVASPPPANLPQGDYVLTNGRGEVLLEATDLQPAQGRSADPDTGKLDGTINVVATKDGEAVYTQTLTHTPSVPVRLRWEVAQERFVLTEAPPRARGARTTGGGSGDGAASGDGGGGGY